MTGMAIVKEFVSEIVKQKVENYKDVVIKVSGEMSIEKADMNYKEILKKYIADSKDDNSEKEINTDNCRPLTEEEKNRVKEATGWSDEKIDKKCTIDEDGIIHYKTDRCDLEGKTSERGVPYERKIIEINGVKIEGVFPVFESQYDTMLDPDDYKSNNYADICNQKLKEAIEKDPELRNKFTAEQIKEIENGETPTGYVWHHNEEPGKMQLVKRADHDKTLPGGAAHTGGNSLWGPDSKDKTSKGETF